MDPASLALACAGIAGLTKAANRMTRTMIKVYRDKDGIRSDIHASIRRLQTTTGIISMAMDSLRKAVDEDPQSEVATFLREELVLDGIGDEADLLTTTMNALTKKIKSTTTFRDFRWVLRMKNKVDALIPFSSNVHLLLQSAANSILLERSKALPAPSEAHWRKMADNMLQHIETEAQQIIASLKQLGDYELKPAARVLWQSQQPHYDTNAASAVSKVLALSEELQRTGTVPEYAQSETSSQASASWSVSSSVTSTRTRSRSSSAAFSDQDEIPIRPSQPKSPCPAVHQLVTSSTEAAGGTAFKVVYRRHPLHHSRWELEKQAHGCFFSASMFSIHTSCDTAMLTKCQAVANIGASLISPGEARRLGFEVQRCRPSHMSIDDYGPFIIVGVARDILVRPFVNSEHTFALDFIVCDGLDWIVLGQTLFLVSS